MKFLDKFRAGCAWRRAKFGIVGATFSICVAAIFLRPAAPRRIPPPPPGDLYAVVLDQLAAMRAADYPAAYRHVSLAMQERFNLDDFAGQVRVEQPGLARYERVEFGAIVTQGRHALLPAWFFLRDGSIVFIHYTFVREEGAWKIDASRVSRRWSRGHRLAGERT